MTGTDHECHTEDQFEELMSLRAKYFLHAWGQLAEACPQCFSQEVYRLLVPEVVDAIARLDIAIAGPMAKTLLTTVLMQSTFNRSKLSELVKSISSSNCRA